MMKRKRKLKLRTHRLWYLRRRMEKYHGDLNGGRIHEVPAQHMELLHRWTTGALDWDLDELTTRPLAEDLPVRMIACCVATAAASGGLHPAVSW